MGLLRSEGMNLYEIFMPIESAWTIMNELGKVASLHFIDINENLVIFSRPYSQYIKRCDESDRIIHFMQNEMQRFNIPIITTSVEQFLEDLDLIISNRNLDWFTYFEEVEKELSSMEETYLRHLDAYTKLNFEYFKLKEQYYVLLKASNLMLPSDIDNLLNDQYNGQPRNFSFSSVTGVINDTDIQRFRGMIFRATRGNVLIVFESIEELFKNPVTDEEIKKSVFIIFYRGGSYDTLKTKLKKICDTFGVNTYLIPEQTNQINEELNKIQTQIKEKETVIKTTKNNQLLVTLNKLSEKQGNSSLIMLWKLFVLKEKSRT